MGDTTMRICLAGDVMVGRGVDQILGTPGDPRIHERWVTSAERYVELAERASGTIPRRVPPEYVWGELLEDLRSTDPDAFVVNLETAITDRGRPWPRKGIHYRMHPANIECLTAADIDVVSLANNHVLDWSRPGLDQTLRTLEDHDLLVAGAGHDQLDAWTPVIVDGDGTRVAVIGACTPDSGVPGGWSARHDRPGVALLDDLSDDSVDRIGSVVSDHTDPSDVVVLSIHWGGNWGYPIPDAHRRFAAAVIDRAGVDIVHGHSSHHPLGMEVHRGRPIIYGCGDLITDYEGIGGHEALRPHLGGLYLVTIDRSDGSLRRLEVIPSEMRRFQLRRPSRDDAAWLASVLDREGGELGTDATLTADGRIEIGW